MSKRIYRSQFSIPVEFEKSNVVNFSDKRFTPVKIWIAHTGENRNNSIFSKEALEYMIPSLSNIPILGFIQEGDNGIDFTDHREVIKVENGNVEIQYLGRAYGLIPESNNARFEFRYGEDGREREYLVCDGIIWNKFKETNEIFDRDNGFKSQSMELEPSSIVGKFNEHGLFEYEKAEVEGACLLGEGVNPAMISSTIEKFSINESQNNGLTEMIKEFNTLFSEIRKEGGNELTEENKNPEEQEETAQDENFEENSDNNDETVDNEETETDETTDESGEVVEDESDEVEEDKEEDKFSIKDKKSMIRKFEISHEDIRWELYDRLDEHEDFKDSWIYISQTYDNHAIAVNEDDGKVYKINYVKHENTVSLGEYEEVFPMYLTKEEKGAIDNSRKSIETLQSELDELKEFKANVELEEKDKVLSQYSEVIKKESYDAIKERFSELSVDDVKKEIGLVLLENNHFSSKEQTAKVGATNVSADNPYGEASVFFTKR